MLPGAGGAADEEGCSGELGLDAGADEAGADETGVCGELGLEAGADDEGC